MAAIAQKTFEGHQRAIIGTLSIEEIYRDRQKFNHAVREVAGVDVGNLGLEIVSFTIKGVEDSEGYLSSLGKKRIAEVKRDARVGEALAERDAGVKQAIAKNEQMNAFYSAEICIADSKREFELKQSEYDLQVNAEKAKASFAGELAAAKVNQAITQEKMQIDIIARHKLIEIEGQQIELSEKKLQGSVRIPIEAEKFKLEMMAEGVKSRIIKEAEAASAANELIGMAEADIIKLTGDAEAEQMRLKADAWKSYSQGAYMEMLIAKLPLIAAEIAKPLSNADSIVMISTGESEIGAAKMTREIIKVMEQLPPMIESMTGVSMSQTMDKVSSAKKVNGLLTQ